MAKERNPPNVPQVRPIETFWAHFKSRIFKNGFKPKSIEDLKKRAKLTIRTFDKDYFERLMKSVPKKVRQADSRGSLFFIN